MRKLDISGFPVLIDSITREIDEYEGETSFTGLPNDAYHYDYQWTFINYKFCNVGNSPVLSIKFTKFDFTDDGSFKKRSRLTVKQKGDFMTGCNIAFRGRLLRKGHKYIVAIQKVETASGTWLVDTDQLTVAAKSVIAGKQPKLPTPVFQPKK